MRALVAAQVDALARARDPVEERGDELVLRADEREDRAVVVGVGVDVEQARVRGEGAAERVDRAAVAAFREVRDGLERQHRTTLRAVKAYYDARAPEYDEWYLGVGKFADAGPAGLGARDGGADGSARAAAGRAGRSTSRAAPAS